MKIEKTGFFEENFPDPEMPTRLDPSQKYLA